MQLKYGTIYRNRTLRYLVPGLRKYGEPFITKMNNLPALGFFLFDSVLDGTHYQDQKNIYIIYDTAIRASFTNTVINWFRNQYFFVTQYPVGENPRLACLVIQYPFELENTYDAFMRSKYSFMYVKEEIDKFFFGEIHHEARGVLLKTKNSAFAHIKKVKEDFGTELSLAELAHESYQYDYPWNKEEEIFTIVKY